MPRDLSLCPGCFERKASEQGTCPRCGYDQDHERLPLSLPAGTELKGRYVAGRVLGDPGGFGITYLGFDRLQEERVAIKEYMPRELAGRDTDGRSVVPHSGKGDEEFEYGKDRFLGEARALAQFDHANIAKARDFFEANGTAYLVMDYYEGKTLKQYLSEQPDGRMNPEPAAEVMLRVLDGLQAVHAEEYLHRDIKPENIYLTKEGRPILIDFGAARQAMGERSQSLSVVMTEGYAPYEQYRRRGDQGPHTDVYGCGATLYRMVTGQTPEPASERIVDDRLEVPQNLNSEVPAALGEVIVEAMAVKGKERPQTAEVFQRQLRAVLRGPAPEEPGDVGRVDSESAASDGTPGQDIPEDGGLSREAEAPPEGKESAVRPAPGSTETNEGMLDGVNWAQGVIVLLVVAALGLGGVAVALYPSGGVSGTSQTKKLLEDARGHLQAGRLTRPEGANALSTVQAALNQTPENEEAQQLLSQVANRLAERGDSARAEGSLSAAVDFYERSLQVEDQSVIRKKLEATRQRVKQQQKADQLLAEVRSALEKESPSARALREAAEVARSASDLGSSEEASALLDQIANRAVELGREAESSFQYGAVVRYYELSVELREDSQARERLASARKVRKGRASIRTLRGHEDWMTDVAFSPDGSRVATGSQDETAKLWSVQAGELIRTLRGHQGTVQSVAFSPDGQLLATGSYDETAKLWSAQTGKLVQTLRGHEGSVNSVSFSPDGSRVATGSGDNTAKLWSVKTGGEVQTMRHGHSVQSVAYSSGGELIVTGGYDGIAKQWSVKPRSVKPLWEENQTMRGHESGLQSVSFSPDGSRLATGGGDNTAKLWSVESGEEVQTMRGHDDWVNSVVYSLDEEFVATGSRDGTAKLWSTQSGKVLHTFQGHEESVSSVAFSPDGKLLVTGSIDSTAKLWYVPQGL